LPVKPLTPNQAELEKSLGAAYALSPLLQAPVAKVSPAIAHNQNQITSSQKK
jgi:hypothetical protein